MRKGRFRSRPRDADSYAVKGGQVGDGIVVAHIHEHQFQPICILRRIIRIPCENGLAMIRFRTNLLQKSSRAIPYANKGSPVAVLTPCTQRNANGSIECAAAHLKAGLILRAGIVRKGNGRRRCRTATGQGRRTGKGRSAFADEDRDRIIDGLDVAARALGNANELQTVLARLGLARVPIEIPRRESLLCLLRLAIDGGNSDDEAGMNASSGDSRTDSEAHHSAVRPHSLTYGQMKRQILAVLGICGRDNANGKGE